MPETKVFLSYSSLDSQIARRIAVDLHARGIDVWFDQWSLGVGEPFAPAIEAAVAAADYVLVLVTRRSIASGWVAREWQQKGVTDDRVIPLRAEVCDMPDSLASQHFVDVAGGSYWPGLEQLTRLLRRLPDDKAGQPAHASRLPMPMPVPLTICLGRDLLHALTDIDATDSPLSYVIDATIAERTRDIGVPIPRPALSEIAEEARRRDIDIRIENLVRHSATVPEDAHAPACIGNALQQALVNHAHLFVDPDLLQKLFVDQDVQNPAPERATWGEVVDFAARCMSQNLPLTDLTTLMSVFPEQRTGIIDTDRLAEDARPLYAQRLTAAATDNAGALHAITLHPETEAKIVAAIEMHGPFRYLRLDPDVASRLDQAAREICARHAHSALVVEDASIRGYLERITFNRHPTLAWRDIAPGTDIVDAETVPPL